MKIKMLYTIKWKGTEVGNVITNDKKEYKYIPNVENIKKLARQGMPCTLVINPQREWKKTLPKYITNRLKLNTPQKRLITDYFSIEEMV